MHRIVHFIVTSEIVAVGQLLGLMEARAFEKTWIGSCPRKSRRNDV